MVLSVAVAAALARRWRFRLQRGPDDLWIRVRVGLLDIENERFAAYLLVAPRIADHAHQLVSTAREVRERVLVHIGRPHLLAIEEGQQVIRFGDLGLGLHAHLYDGIRSEERCFVLRRQYFEPFVLGRRRCHRLGFGARSHRHRRRVGRHRRIAHDHHLPRARRRVVREVLDAVRVRPLPDFGPRSGLDLARQGEQASQQQDTCFHGPKAY